MTTRSYSLDTGRAHPLGATPDDHGVNFSVFAPQASRVDLLLFEQPDAVQPYDVIQLDPSKHCTFGFWHVYGRGLRPGLHYAYRAHGPRDVQARGLRFDASKVLIDPYARGNNHALWDRSIACGAQDNLETSMRSVVLDTRAYDWEGDLPLNQPMADTIIYEMHVGGFTRAPSAGVAHPGTFAAVIEKIPYLQQLGVTAVELMPVHQFDPQEDARISSHDGRPLVNYWGYATVGFFAPHPAYCVSPEEGRHLDDFRDMVKALHRAGIEVILDVVLNHTSEGNHQGPTISLKGLANDTYYHLVPEDRQFYLDYSGCGNTLNCNHPVVGKMLADCLEFWVREMHVDGFRFDEASILARGEDGAPMRHPPLVWNVELSDTLSQTKLIAEAWDAAGLYQVGQFPGYRWAEWNGRYRDDIRRFVRGDRGLVGAVAARIAGSSDLYQAEGRRPVNSINFITCHDGFTLRDLVSYNQKRNEANGWGNRDGIDDNLSWNCGYEGETDDPAVNALRLRQIKNCLAILLLSQGVPMLMAGDELGRTQQGNNNAYCQDNEVTWIDWRLLEANAGLLDFARGMIALRKAHASLRRTQFFTGAVNERGLKDIDWHGCLLGQPGWHDPASGVLAFTLGGSGDEPDLHVMMNMEDQDLTFEVPSASGLSWWKAVDTAQASPHDLLNDGAEVPVVGAAITVAARSVVVLRTRPYQCN